MRCLELRNSDPQLSKSPNPKNLSSKIEKLRMQKHQRCHSVLEFGNAEPWKSASLAFGDLELDVENFGELGLKT